MTRKPHDRQHFWIVNAAWHRRVYYHYVSSQNNLTTEPNVCDCGDLGGSRSDGFSVSPPRLNARYITLLTDVNSGSGGDNDSNQLVPQPASRKRPLRTYGRRTQLLPDHGLEPPRKKRVVEDSSNATSQSQPSPPSSPQLPRLPVQPRAPVSVKRGSILAFFKPISAPTSSSTTHSEISSDAKRSREDVIPSSPPSSPPVLARPAKRRRRLTTRITTIGGPNEGKGQKEQESEEPEIAEEAEENVVAGSHDAEEPDTVELGHSSVLHELKSSLLNAGTPTSGETAEGGFKVKHEAKQRTRKVTVQTTLNLSMADEPVFTICKECEILYNPLNEKDRRDHAKQHAAALRRKGGVPV